jgi:choline kinase
MISVILAAGRGRRMGAGDDSQPTVPTPKVLLRFGNKSLLERHLAILESCGIGEVFIVVGFAADQVRDEVARIGPKVRVSFIENPRFAEGSVVSLRVAEPVMKRGEPVLLMDGDVLYDRRLMERLVRTRSDNCLLMDREIEPGDEPVKLCIRDGRIVDFHKVPNHAHDWHGESVGFFRLSPGVAEALVSRARDYVESGRGAMEYEEPLRDLILASPAGAFGYEDVTDLPWTEIDFPEDVVKAETEIRPALRDDFMKGGA